MTMLTDYLLAGVCLFFAWKLARQDWNDDPRPGRLWVLGFTAIALAALVGGTFHGFRSSLSPAWAGKLWNLTVFLIGLGAAFLISAGTLTPFLRQRPSGRWLSAGVVLAAAGLALQQSGLFFRSFVNHNDLYHLIQIASFYCVYRAIRAVSNQ